MKQGDVDKEALYWIKVRAYIESLLVDERSTLGDINRSSLTFQVEAASLSMGSVGAMGDNRDNQKRHANRIDTNVRWNKRIDSRLLQKNVDFSFGMIQLSLAAVMVLLPVVVFHLYEHVANTRDAERLSNSVRLFSLASEMWNTNNLMRQALLTTLLWNNTKPVLGKPAAEAYLDMSAKIRNIIVPGLLEMRHQQLADDFEAYFYNITSDYKVCDLVKKYGTGLAKCGDNSLTAQDTNFVMFLRSIVALTDDIYEVWKVSRNSANITAELMHIPKFKNYMGITHNYSIIRDLYYVIMAPLSSSLLNLLETTMARSETDQVGQADQNQRWQYYITFVIPITLITALSFYRFVYRRLLATVFSFWHTAFLIPMNLIKKNALLDSFFKDLSARSKTKITFF